MELVAPEVWRGMVGNDAWAKALRVFDGQRVPVAGDTTSFEVAGMLNSDGFLNQQWCRALTAASQPVQTGSLVARQGRIMFITHVVLGEQDAVTVLNRALGREDDNKIEAVEPWAEVALASKAELWTLLRRVLPNDPNWRRAPVQGLPAPQLVEIPQQLPPVCSCPCPEQNQWISSVLEYTPEFADAIFASSRVGLTVEGQEPLSWVLHEDRLYQMKEDAMLKVAAGDVANQMIDALQ